jgi:hypothetical protein
MLDEATRAAIREAYRAGTLKVEAADPATGAASLQTVTAVLQHRTPHKDMVRVTLADGRWVECTVDHSLFRMAGEGVTPVLAGELRVGSVIATVSQGVAVGVEVASVVALPPEEHTYDLSVPGPQNFVLANGILAHNSYSIGGVSLDIEKASKYESLKQNAEGQFDKAAEAKARTVKFIRGIQQPKYGIGIRSAFGPFVGRGVLSPRNFLAVCFSLGAGYHAWEVLTHAHHLSSLFA